MSNLRATQAESVATKSRHRKHWPIIICALVCAAVALGVVGWAVLYVPQQPVAAPENRPIESPQAQYKPAAAVSIKTKPDVKKQTSSEQPKLVDDDGKTLWVSPTHGQPLDLGYLSPGAQIIAVLRPAALLKHPEGERVRAALGPAAQADIEFVEQAVGMRVAEIDQLVVGAAATSEEKWMLTFVAHMPQAMSRDALLKKLQAPAEKNHDGITFWLANERAYYLPSAANGKVLVVAPADAIADIIDLAGNPPPLRRDIERLIAHTDASRHATIIVAPNSLFSEGQSIFSGELARLRGPLFWFLGDELSGAALSMHWDENFFLELIATPTLDTPPERAARIFTKRCGEVPDKLEKYVKGLDAQAYGREIVGRFPAMVRKLATYIRSGFESDHAVLRCYLPVVAGHNLLMAAELTLAESPGEKTQVAAANTSSSESPAVATTPAGVHDRLAKITSLRFAKDTLEAALEQLSQDIGVTIIIRGPDLQAEGITKNQSFGIDISNKPAEEILVQILRLANPDKSATAANDPRQKLVYIIEQKPDKTEQIVVTACARAAERHNELPPAFRAKAP